MLVVYAKKGKTTSLNGIKNELITCGLEFNVL